MTLTKLSMAFFVLASICSAEDFDIITRTPLGPGREQIRIDQPNPTKRSVDYAQITFQPNDTVTITAGGCVQSGGTGPTWHRYVDPIRVVITTPPQTATVVPDQQYHGLITIPYATGILERIEKYQSQQVHVPASAPPANLHLQLGFEDDNYGDNGYYSHDDGPLDQCKLPAGGPAWVLLVIAHNAPPPPADGTRDWDLKVTQFDDNGIPLNPDWQARAAGKPFPNPDTCQWPFNNNTTGIPACTSPNQISGTDTFLLCQAFSTNYGFGGHANFIAATHTGTVVWEGKAAVLTDDEYTMNLSTPGAAGATQRRPEGVHVEFDSDETVDLLADNFKLPWWRAFKTAVDSGDDKAHSFLDGMELIVTGLMGVDFAHAPIGGESHPAWAVAFHTNSDFADDTWAFFLRGWGNEGYCSGEQHYISYLNNQYTFRIPWPAGATGGQPRSGTTFLANVTAGAATVTVVAAERVVLLTFHDLPDPLAHGLIAGELHVSWTGTPSTPRRRQVTGPLIATPPEPAESFASESVANLTPAQRKIYSANAPKRIKPAAKPVVAVKWQVGPQTEVMRGRQRPQISSAPDVAELARKNAEIEALKKAGITPPASRR